MRMLAFVLTLFATPAFADPPAGYVPTFSDTFTSLSVSDSPTNDGSTWYTRSQPCCMSVPSGGGVAGAYLYPGLGRNGTAQALSSPIVQIPGSGVDLQLTVQTASNAPYNTASWVGSQIATMAYDRKGFAQRYGYFEIRAKFDSAGGTWPAFWLMPVGTIARGDGIGGEIDVFEHYGQFPNAISIALHDLPHNTVAARKNYDAGVDLAADYHVYGLMWDKDNITVYLDGAQVFQAPTPSQMHQPYYLLLTHGEGGGWPQPDSNGPFHYKVSYVKAWQAPSGSAPPPAQPRR